MTIMETDRSNAADIFNFKPSLITSEPTVPANSCGNTVSTAQDLPPEQAHWELELFNWLHSSKDVKQFGARIGEITQTLGFSFYNHMPITALTTPTPFGNVFSKFWAPYEKEELFADDLITKHVLKRPDIVVEKSLYDAIRQLPIRNEMLERNLEIDRLATNAGLAHRIDIPIHDGDYRAVFCLLAASTSACPAEEQNFDRLRSLAQVVDHIGRQRFASHFLIMKRPPIGIRPLQLFALLMKDLSLQEAAHVMGISESTAKHHVANGKRVFKAQTLHGLMIAVDRLGIVDDL